MQTLPQNIAAKIVSNTAPVAARMVKTATPKGQWKPLLVLEFAEAAPVGVTGRSSDGLRKWAAKYGLNVQ
jgi:hypothetical protein